MPDPSGKTAFLKGQMALQVAGFFTSETSEKSATSKAIWPWKKAVFPRGSGIQSFECQFNNEYF